jgi:CubicO group peptidase (beta-lactamase class C family)
MKSYASLLGLSGLFIQTSTYAKVPDWQQQVSNLVQKEFTSAGIPSIQIAIGQGNNIIFEKAYGLADIENQVAATSKTKYRIASISKWMTSTAAMSLVESGKLDLDKSITEYCPAYTAETNKITTRHLLSHTSGIRHYANYHKQFEQAKTDEDYADVEKRFAQSRLGRFTRYTDLTKPLKGFKDDPLLFTPGTDWKYTSFGYRVLGCVIEGASKQDYREVMNSVIFEPTNMTHTTDDDAWKIIPNRSSGYRINKDKQLRRANMRDVSENLPAGGHLSTATDLVKFALAFNNNDLIKEKTKQAMIAPLNTSIEIMHRAPTWRDAIPSQKNYSHGVMLFPQTDRVNIGHSGRQAGADSMVVLDVKSNISIAILANVKGYNGELQLIEKILPLIKVR